MKKESRDSRCSPPCLASQTDFLLARHGIQALTASAWDARPCCLFIILLTDYRAAFYKKKRIKLLEDESFLPYLLS